MTCSIFPSSIAAIGSAGSPLGSLHRSINTGVAINVEPLYKRVLIGRYDIGCDRVRIFLGDASYLDVRVTKTS